jgi:hypothetical protein
VTLTLPFGPDVDAKMRERDAAAGKDVAALVREAVEEKLASNGGAAAAKVRDAWVRSHRPIGHSIDQSGETR